MGSGDRTVGTLTHCGFSRLGFTLQAPGICRRAYPTGALLAMAIAEGIYHFLRYLSFQNLVFPRSQGFHVAVPLNSGGDPRYPHKFTHGGLIRKSDGTYYIDTALRYCLGEFGVHMEPLSVQAGTDHPAKILR